MQSLLKWRYDFISDFGCSISDLRFILLVSPPHDKGSANVINSPAGVELSWHDIFKSEIDPLASGRNPKSQIIPAANHPSGAQTHQ